MPPPRPTTTILSLSLWVLVSPSFWLHLCYMKFVMPSCLQLFGKSPHAKLSSLSTIVHRSQLTRFAAAFVDRELKCTVFTYWNNPPWGCFLRSFKRPEEWDSALKRRLSSTSGYSLPTHHQSGRQLLNFFGGFVSILFSFLFSTLPCSHHVYDARVPILGFVWEVHCLLTGVEEMSTEESVGILCHANSCPGFRGVLKQRLLLFLETLFKKSCGHQYKACGFYLEREL